MTTGNNEKIAILGAAGATGKPIGSELARRGKWVRFVGRNLSRLQAAFGNLGGELVAADLETPEGAARAVAGIDTAIMTVGLPYPEFHRYPPMMKVVMEACRKAGVRRFLLVTNIYMYGTPQSNLVTEDHPLNPVAFKGKMRLEQQRAVENSGLEWIVLHLPDFYGPDAELSYADMIVKAALKNKPADLFVPSDTPHQFVYTPDIAPVIASLLEREDGWNERYHFAGSGILSVRDFARKVYEVAGVPFRGRNVPLWMVRLLGIFMPLMREFVEMDYLQTTPVNLDDSKLVRHLGTVHRTSYDDGIRSMVAAYSRR